MTLKRTTFETTASGTTLTTSNANGDQFSAVSVGSGNTLAIDNTRSAHAQHSLKAQTAGTNSTQAEMAFTGTPSTLTVRMYMYRTANPSATILPISVLNASTIACQVKMNSTGKLAIANSASTIVATIATAIPLNQWFRFDFTVTTLSTTLGAATINRYDNLDATAPTDTISTSNQNFAVTTATRFLIGQLQGTVADGPVWIDALASNDTGAAIGSATRPGVAALVGA